jgi:5-oxoprolinase (ATP-hydrolysing) subunit C
MSDAAIVVVRGGLQSIVVDRGRVGYRGDGVNSGGALDAVAFAVGNLLAGNEVDAAAIEIAFGGVAVRFERDVRFALSGADCGGEIDGVRVDAWGSYEARAGSTLTLGRPKRGARSYLALAGGIDVPVVMGSRDTNVAGAFGGYCGRALRQGDRLQAGAPPARAFAREARPRCKPPQWDFARAACEAVEMPVRFLAGGEYALLSRAAQRRFSESTFSVSAQSNRMGARLEASEAIAIDCSERASHAVFPGVVQLPPSGAPIVLLADAQVTGGYPKLGAVADADLWKVAQLPPGGKLRFVSVSPAEASEAREEIAEYLLRVEGSLS